MATIAQWEDEMETLTGKEIKEIEHSLDTLSNWDFFEAQYDGLGVVRAVITMEKIRRLLAAVETALHATE